ncbi:hypothetical protein ACHAW5_001616 [Stephanodiscus triporus]|uniref:Thiaminase-2/PQQC domain-containing protein n=1 Tax=Stephanodiscus triporus TaxID=2934178 RepID=A0ABD3Q1F6_9STRA
MAQSFWDAAAPVISVTERHPFLVSMVEGTLKPENFAYYAIQDSLYLTNFADCLRLLGEKMADLNAEVSIRLHQFAAGVEEDEMHRTFFKQWNIDTTNAEPMPNTLLYTSYMMRIVSTRPLAEGLAVLLPCFWVYMHVGNCMLKLREKLGDSVERPPEFDAWIDMYSGEGFEKVVNDYKAIVDDMSKGVDSETLKRMEGHFIMACKLEHLFWDQANDLAGWPEFSESK